MLKVRNYQDEDYESVANLYKDSSLYGGQFDEARDSAKKLSTIIKRDPEAILICEDNGAVVGTLSLIEDGRVAWLFRFAVLEGEANTTVARVLYDRAVEILRSRGHKQVLVYSPNGNTGLDTRYVEVLGFNKGNNYTCFWKDL